MINDVLSSQNSAVSDPASVGIPRRFNKLAAAIGVSPAKLATVVLTNFAARKGNEVSVNVASNKIVRRTKHAGGPAAPKPVRRPLSARMSVALARVQRKAEARGTTLHQLVASVLAGGMEDVSLTASEYRAIAAVMCGASRNGR
jgi:hypothetical protein